MGKLLISHRYNRIPLLNSLPGGFYRSWSYKTYPSAKVTLFSKSAKRKRKIRKKESPCGASASRNRGNDKGKQPDTRAPRRSERNGSVRISPAIRVSPTTARRFERAEAPPRQAPPRQNRKLRLLLRSACTIFVRKFPAMRRKLIIGLCILVVLLAGIGIYLRNGFYGNCVLERRSLYVRSGSEYRTLEDSLDAAIAHTAFFRFYLPYRTRPVVQTRALRAGTGNERRTSGTYAQTGIADARAGDDQ